MGDITSFDPISFGYHLKHRVRVKGFIVRLNVLILYQVTQTK